MQSIFPPQSLTKILGEVVADAGRTQLRTAETEKYPHVTYFLNGGREQPFPGEDRIMVPSPKVATYDLQPEMSAPELTDKVVAAIDSGKYDLIVLNYANPDMVGHTGSLPAAIKAVETVDAGLGRIADAIERAGGALVVTADHGNCEMMRDPETGGPHTAHTTNPVPLFLLGARNRALVTEGRLADIAPTLLELMDLPKPAEMTGRVAAAGRRLTALPHAVTTHPLLLRRTLFLTAHFDRVGTGLVMYQHVDAHPSQDDHHDHADRDPHVLVFVASLVFFLARHVQFLWSKPSLRLI